eukprot:Opistho-1_new@19382
MALRSGSSLVLRLARAPLRSAASQRSLVASYSTEPTKPKKGAKAPKEGAAATTTATAAAATAAAPPPPTFDASIPMPRRFRMDKPDPYNNRLVEEAFVSGKVDAVAQENALEETERMMRDGRPSLRISTAVQGGYAFQNRNPRNPEMMGSLRKEKGYYHVVEVTLTNLHTWATVKHFSGREVITVSTTEPFLRDQLYGTGNRSAARNTGLALAQRLRESGITGVVYRLTDGKKYHGRVACFVDGLREGGIALEEPDDSDRHQLDYKLVRH